MTKKILLLLFVATFSSSFSQESEIKNDNDIVTTFYLINSAEKKAPTEKQKDPYLTDEGVKRAEKWSEVLSNVKLDAIYAVNTISSKQTAQSIGEKQKTSIYQFDTTAMYDGSFKYLTDNKNVLIVSDNITSTKFANIALTKEKYTLVENENYGRLYIITITKDAKTSVVLNVN